jgi:UDP-N-acetylmuramate dehydrogenase
MLMKPISDNIKKDVPLRDYSSWRIGGNARWLAECSTREELRAALRFAHDHRCPFLPIGRGSNVLFSDEGFEGLVIVLRLLDFSHQGPLWRAESGFSFAQLGVKSAMAGYSGLEFAAGIPASLGGALFMNAGAQGQETKDCLCEVVTLWPDGGEERVAVTPKDFDYRESPFQQQPVILVEATFELKEDQEARANQIRMVRQRTSTQPYDQPSAGCVFRNPLGAAAGVLIERCGCKGWSEGDAVVSTKHANFIVNAGRATAQDLINLIGRVVDHVKEQESVELHPEVRLITTESGWFPW